MRCALTGLVLAVAASASTSALQSAQVDVAITSRANQPGEVLRLHVTCTCFDDVELVTATAFGKSTPLAFVADDHAWSGLVGIDLATKPGTYRISVTVNRKGAPSLQAIRPIDVLAKTFRTRRLRVAPGFVTPPRSALERIADEAKRLEALFTTISSSTWEGPFVAPAEGQVSSNFGARSIFNGQARSPHGGIDYSGRVGDKVIAPAGGTIVLAEDLYFTGNTVVIDHGLGLYSLLAHLSAFSVQAGDRVSRDQTVGLIGATGRVTAPHLHWTLRVNGARVDPLSLLSVAGR
jgi:murein DD-endopeptidase MepM/ murein hydrolase activator NlpD